MANPLTGDFDAVLQVSESTVNRLLASMHQNAFVNTKLPSFPHSVGLRIGDPKRIDGMRGTVWAQVSVPRIHLMHAVDDRFHLEVAVTARYQPDPGTTPLPEFIHGIIRAEYRLEAVDPSCAGWSRKAGDYLWLRVVGDSVSFTGTAFDDLSAFSVIGSGEDDAAVNARITRLVSVLLRTKFKAMPQHVEHRFRRGSMRSLNVGVNQSVVAVPLGLTGAAPAGRLDSINQDILDGRDFGVAISSQAILGKVQPVLDELKRTFSLTFGIRHRTYLDLGVLGDVDVVEVSIDWTITLSQANAQWSGGTLPFMGMTAGVVVVTLSGRARTQKSIFNWDFDVTQFVLLTFDGGNESFSAAPLGTPGIAFHLPFGAVVEAFAKPRVEAEIGAQVKAAVAQVAGDIDLKGRKTDLIAQLRGMDEAADAHFHEAVFTPDGVIVRGRIFLSPRRGPVHAFVKTPQQDGFTALESWIPGGRIDAFEWTWSWFNNAGAPGNTTLGDRFLLRRPVGGSRGKFGVMAGLTRPLPGVDGMGSVCLNVRGVRVDPVSGDTVPVSSGRRCTRFGLDIKAAAEGRLFLREWVRGPRDPAGPVPEAGLFEVGGRDAAGPGTNTLVLYVSDRWDHETGRTLRDALRSSRRVDAGLLVLVLFRDGTLAAAGAEVLSELSDMAASLEAPILINEDVNGAWSAALAIEPENGENQWRLISPTGGVTWGHRGAAASRELAGVLDAYLFPSAPAPVESVQHGPSLGTRLTSVALDSGIVGRVLEFEDPCPPPPLGWLGLGSEVVFVQMGSAASEAALRRLARDHDSADGSEPSVAVVVDGAGAEDLERLRRDLHADFIAIPDLDGVVSRRFGVRAWPTRVSVNEHGTVTGVHVGTEDTDRPRVTEGAS